MIDLRTDNPDSLDWQTSRTAETLAELTAIDGYAALETTVLGYSSAATRRAPIRAGNRWFQEQHLDADAELPAITVRDSPDAEPRVLIDANEHVAADGAPVALSWAVPSPNGSYLAYAIAAEGTEVSQVLLVDVATGRRRADEVPWNIVTQPSWLPDETGFWCTTRETGEGTVNMRVRRYILGETAPDWMAPLPDSVTFPRPEVSRDGRLVAICTGNTEQRVDYLIDEDLNVRPFLDGVPGAFRGVFDGDTFCALTDNGAPLGRIVNIPIDTASDPDTWTEVLGEGTDYIADFDILGDTLVVARLHECSMAIDVIDLKTEERSAVPLPGRGGVGALFERAAHPGLPVFTRNTDEIAFVYSSPAQSPAVYRYLLDERRLDCWEPSSITLDDVTVRYLTAVSADGTQVPVHIVHRADLDLDRPHPTFLTGYGGFHLADMPAYLGGHAEWVRAGGIYVHAHLRGGGEFGADWWRQGRRYKKQNTFDDFYAVARHLIDTGWTSTHQLAVYGASNGGVLTAAALVQRPDLWGAVVSDVPITDLLHLHENPLTFAIGRDEYGDPQIPEERIWLAAIDPLSNVKPADYPATLVIAGADDPRCPAAQARLLVDAVRAAHTGDAPILLRIHPEQGHGAHGTKESAQRLTEILAFCAAHTGLRFGQALG